MRIIKFRGKRIDNGEWIIGDIIHSASMNKSVNKIRIKSVGLSESYSVDFATVGQFTGLTDKNGKEIYEGDILLQKTTEKFKEVNSLVWERIYTVVFGNCDFNPRWSGCSTYCFYLQGTKPNTIKGVGKISSDNIMGYYPYEVIGNIHDNKELLK